MSKSRFFDGIETFLKTFIITDKSSDYILYSAIEEWMSYMNISYIGIETYALKNGYNNVCICEKQINNKMNKCLVGIKRKENTSLDSFLKYVEYSYALPKPLPKLTSKQNIPKSVKTHIWDLYIGPHINEHRCLCCKKTLIKITSFDVGHVISEANGGTLEINNLRPICSVCNFSMKTTDMIEFVKKYGYYIG